MVGSSADRAPEREPSCSQIAHATATRNLANHSVAHASRAWQREGIARAREIF
jgi:hypothetical protein